MCENLAHLLAMPPWALLSLGFGTVSKWQEIKQLTQLSFLAVRGTDGAKCELCTIVVNILMEKLEVTGLNDGTVDCDALCYGLPFKGKCIDTCDNVVGAMANSTGYPCAGAGLCPAVDEFGEVSCEFSHKALGCVPAHSCTYRFPRGCELKPGVARWKRMTNLVSNERAALA